MPRKPRKCKDCGNLAIFGALGKCQFSENEPSLVSLQNRACKCFVRKEGENEQSPAAKENPV